MILQALKAYYDRKVADPDSGIAAMGWESKEIPYVIVLNPEGVPIDIQYTVEGTKKEKRAKTFVVPQGVKRTVGIASNWFWDNPDYALGLSASGDSEEKIRKRHDAFRERVALFDTVEDPGLKALKSFLDRTSDEKLALLQGFPMWSQLLKEGKNLSFKLAGKLGLICDSVPVRNAYNSLRESEEGEERICLVTGESAPFLNLHPSIRGVWGGNTTGTNIVGFNLDSFCSFGKKQGENAPVSKSAAFAYTTALNTMLQKDSNNRMQVGEASTVFWAQEPCWLEENFGLLMSEPSKDNPDAGIEAVRALYKSLENGSFTPNREKNRFFVLGLSPNSARLAIRFWIASKVSEMEGNIARHYRDLEIIHSKNDSGFLSIFRLLVSLAVERKAENIPPNLEGDFIRAALEGLPYSRGLLAAAIRRCRAEEEVTFPRAALMKACLNRFRNTNENTEKEILVSLDIQNANIGYCLGRLFALLEKVQQEAAPGGKNMTTIRDRFYSSASSTPASVFSTLVRLSKHHLAKLENEGRRINLERLFAEIMSKIDEFPRHLSLENQGRFAIGYYHQMQQFFVPKADSNAQNNESLTSEIEE